MGEYVGSESGVALQKALRQRGAEIAASPLLSNGGRILNVLDPEAYGWDNVRKLARGDGFVGLTMVDRDQTLSQLETLFGDEAEFPYWQVFTGDPESVLPSCQLVLDTYEMPNGWRIESYTHPSEQVIDISQQLNLDAGVAPSPAYYLRGEEIPSLLTCVYDDSNNMIGCASGTMRYHPQSKLSNWLFAGGVSVSPDHRRKQLGTLINASLLIDSHREFGWVSVLEQAKADNPASKSMIKRCGLREAENEVTVVVNLTGDRITR